MTLQPSKEILEELYWNKLMTMKQIANELVLSNEGSLTPLFRKYGIPVRKKLGTANLTGGRWIRKYSRTSAYWGVPDPTSPRYERPEHHLVMEELLGRSIDPDKEVVHHKDGNGLNNHYLNLEASTRQDHNRYLLKGEWGGRPSLYLTYMALAYMTSSRSTCLRAKVGAIVVTHNLQSVLSIGYNGTASGLENTCDSDAEGNCGCIHAEENALIKCQASDRNKVIFITTSPCFKCAKLIVNSGFSWVYYGEPYKQTAPLAMLHHLGVKTCPYPIGLARDVFTYVKPTTGETLCPCGCGRLLDDTNLAPDKWLTADLMEKTYPWVRPEEVVEEDK